MHYLINIQRQFPLKERQYTDRNVVEKTFCSRGFLLDFGKYKLYAEMTGEQAQYFNQACEGRRAWVAVTFDSRPWTDQKGEERWEVKAYINNLEICS